MPPRIPLRLRLHPSRQCLLRPLQPPPAPARLYATAAAAITPSPSHEQITHSAPPILHYPPTQIPSHRPPEFRKSQLHRQYTSLLRSTPLMLLFQHNNLKSAEWMSIRRELATALEKVDATLAAAGREPSNLATGIKLNTVQTGIFAAALRVVEFYKPEEQTSTSSATADADAAAFTHGLSRSAHAAVSKKKRAHALSPLLSGPLVLVTFPTVSPEHLAAVLSTLAPSAPDFPAPKRRTNPGYHEPAVQSGLQKLLLLGARVEGKVFDTEGTKWVGGIGGGLDGLRARLVAMLQGIGGGVTNALESASRSLYFTVEGRRMMLDEEENGGKKEEQAEGKAEGEGEKKDG
ncbi:MAG: hypothetical protein M1819_000229 [Sarea resinae]|nr:MAG: hypothetical protein M1819_000229 [Sarea resinae]